MIDLIIKNLSGTNQTFEVDGVPFMCPVGKTSLVIEDWAFVDFIHPVFGNENIFIDEGSHVAIQLGTDLMPVVFQTWGFGEATIYGFAFGVVAGGCALLVRAVTSVLLETHVES